MSARHENPIPRLAHNLLEILAILRDGRTPTAESVEEAILDHAAIGEYVEVQEVNLLTLCQDLNEAHREINRLRALIPAAMRDAEQQLIDRSFEFGEAALKCARQRETVEALRQESTKDYEIKLHHEPRNAAGA